MLQEISPLKFRNEFYLKQPKATDYALFYENNTVLLIEEKEGGFRIPKFHELEQYQPDIYHNCDYLFAIDEHGFYLVNSLNNKDLPLHNKQDVHIFRTFDPGWLAFAGITGYQLYRFYGNNKFCGRCGHQMVKSTKERAMCCEQCNHVVYPKISPAVIVAITHGDRLLMTRYSKGVYKRYSLVAGYVEFGETLEEAVVREVKEEVGLKIKNIRYYKNQPWSFSESLLVGFFAELDGSDEITLDEKELAEAIWFQREEIPVNPQKISLTNEMVEAFRNKRFPYNFSSEIYDREN